MKDDKLLIVISGPAGAGKGTVVKELVKNNERIMVSISATTRKPRANDIPDVTYHFFSREKFESTIAEGGFLEYACYCGNYYGSPKKQVEDWMRQGNDVILEIDVQGFEQIKNNYPDCVGIFIAPPSMEELERRLRKRGTEDEETILKRLEIARHELGKASEYDYVIVNGPLDECVADVISVINAEKQTGKRWRL